jgi:hypothetical protein
MFLAEPTFFLHVEARKLRVTTKAAFCRAYVCSFRHHEWRSTMDGHSQLENSLSLVQWLAGWAVIVGTCILFWLAVYRWAVDWRAAY